MRIKKRLMRKRKEPHVDVFGFSKDDFIDGIEIGGAGTFLGFAADADIQLFI